MEPYLRLIRITYGNRAYLAFGRTYFYWPYPGKSLGRAAVGRSGRAGSGGFGLSAADVAGDLSGGSGGRGPCFGRGLFLLFSFLARSSQQPGRGRRVLGFSSCGHSQF